MAASCGKGDILEWLVKDQGVDVGTKDLESGWTALHRSVFYGYLDCTVKLLQVLKLTYRHVPIRISLLLESCDLMLIEKFIFNGGQCSESFIKLIPFITFCT